MKKIFIGALVAALATIVLFVSQPNTIQTPEPTVVASQSDEKPQEEKTIHVTGTTKIAMEKPQTNPQN
ncbi:MAG: hypothetical protein WCO16_00600 [bacterium]